MVYLWLTLASIFGWFVSTLAGGGSSFLLMPIVGIFLGAVAIPPIITTGAILGNAERAFAYREKLIGQSLLGNYRALLLVLV